MVTGRKDYFGESGGPAAILDSLVIFEQWNREFAFNTVAGILVGMTDKDLCLSFTSFAVVVAVSPICFLVAQAGPRDTFHNAQNYLPSWIWCQIHCGLREKVFLRVNPLDILFLPQGVTGPWRSVCSAAVHWIWKHRQNLKQNTSKRHWPQWAPSWGRPHPSWDMLKGSQGRLWLFKGVPYLKCHVHKPFHQ